MANTYTLISSNTLSSSAASVTFSSIPATFTDLVLKISARVDGTSGGIARSCGFKFNGIATNYSYTSIFGPQATPTVTSWRGTDWGRIPLEFFAPTTSATTSTFGSAEIYIPSYTATTSKPINVFSTNENNTSEGYIDGLAGLWANSAAISSILIYPDANNFASGSSFYLYGISKN